MDDDEGVRESLHAVLESYAIAVEGFASIDEFIQRYDGRREGCLVLDLHLPRAGGMVVIDWLRRRMRSALPILVITGHGDKATRSAVLAAGADDFMEKPLDIERLVSAIQDLSSRRPSP
ncbi:response regulator transcription factor [Aliidongia dinghuensis]|uniref:response regulator transcription factor n=1 Tax=Aliidongia dinghuensis TaxID=1867774 RepID=UPI00166C2D11|nr:response regulator [Aliidongia dinghuensis]